MKIILILIYNKLMAVYYKFDILKFNNDVSKFARGKYFGILLQKNNLLISKIDLARTTFQIQNIYLI